MHADSLSFLSEEEKRYVDSIVSSTRRMQFLAGRILARKLLCFTFGGEMEEWQLTARSGIKPVVVGMPDVHVSISHSGDRVACALSDRPVGVDIETIKPGRDARAMAQMTCHPAELAYMDQCQGTALVRHFTELWTIKEAWVKRLGTGIDFERMRKISAVPTACVDGAEAMTMTGMAGAVEQAVAVVSEKIHALHATGKRGASTMWRLSVE